MTRTLTMLLLAVVALCTYASESTEKKYRYAYLEAIRQKEAENYVEAFELLRYCHALKPQAAETNYALGIFYLSLDNDSTGISHLKAACDAEPDNSEFAERLAQSYLYRNRIDEATEVYERLSVLQPTRTEYLDYLAQIYEKQRNYEKLLATLARIEVQEGQSEDITLAKMQVHTMMGDADGAYKELKSLVDAHPNDMNLQVMLGNWLLSNGKKEEALPTLEHALREEPRNAKAQMSLMDYHRAEGNTALADSLLYTMLINPQTDSQTRITLMRDWVNHSEQQGGDSLRIMELFNRVLTLPQTTTEVAEMRAAYLELKQAPRDTIMDAWKQVLNISPEYLPARLQLIQLLWEDSIDENVIRECRKATEYLPGEPMLYYYLGMAQFVNEQYEEAVQSLRLGISNIKADTPTNISSGLYLLTGDALQRLKRSQEAFEAYDSCLIYDPDKVSCLNNYAYYLSCQNKNLKKAEQMSYRAITAEANNATYLDTYAWILYQQKRYDEARIYIDRAIENDTIDTPNGEILDHAGDIYFRLGMAAEALEFWKCALPLGSENDALLRKKIKKGKIVK